MDLPSAPQVRPCTLRGLLSLLLIMIVHCRSQPILPSLSYPVFMFVPSVTQEPDTTASTIPEDGFEVSQFHSQDELGRVVFGFHGPDQSRMEARSLDGSVRGSYSYIDPYGHIVKMQYWDDGTGFHIAGNALPGDGRPAYTPEVKAAREQHLKIYKQTLAAAQHLLQQSDDSSYSDSPEHSSAQDLNQYEDVPQVQQHQDNNLYEDDKESISLENPELLGNHNMYQEDEKKEENDPEKEEVEGEVDLGEDVVPDEDLEEDGYENDQPEMGNDKSAEEEENDRTKEINEPYNHDQIIIRLKHLMGYNQNEENDQKIVSENEKESLEGDINHSGDGYIQNHRMEEEDEVKDEGDNLVKEESDEADKSRQYSAEDESNEKFRDISEGNDSLDYQDGAIINNESTGNSEENNSESDVSYDPETSENRNTEMKLLVQPLAQPETEQIGTQAAEYSNPNTEVETPPAKKRGFFYHFQHTIPKPTERIDEAVEKGLKSADGIEVPPSAIHDPQVAPYPFYN
nr:uncharacterized protein LOC106684482 isoform X2 [Halyomorpha halys]XP_014282100.1 uncharacterized protein LOC106684482 isoform X3 [Halyomorpha halys]